MRGFTHTGRAAHPTRPRFIELVAYERPDGRWDAFAFEPAGVLPADWEQARVDADHVFLGTIDSGQLDAVADRLEQVLGPSYERVLAIREQVPDDDRRCRRAIHLLHKKGCTGYSIRCSPERIHELWVRRRDLPVIEKLR